MPIVTMPDGVNVEFPDDMPDAEIRGMIARKFPDLVQSKSALGRAQQAVLDSGQGQAAGIPFSDEILAGAAAPFRAGYEALTGQGEGGVIDRLGSAYETEVSGLRSRRNAAAERSPVAYGAGALASGLAVGGQAAKGGLTFLNAPRATYPQLIGRGAAEGASYGAVYGAGEGEGLYDRASQAAGGAVVGGLTGAITGGIGARGARKAASKTISTTAQLKAQGDQFFTEMDRAGVRVAPDALDDLGGRLSGKLRDLEFDDDLLRESYPKAAGILNFFRRAGGKVDPVTGLRIGDPKTLGQLNKMRKRLGTLAGSSDREERFIGRELKDVFDEWLAAVPEEQILSGDAQVGRAALNEARKIWHLKSKSEVIDTAFKRAKNKVGANYTAAGYQTAVRQELRKLLDNEKRLRGFTPDEIAAIQKVVDGGKVENLLRVLGKFAPRGVVGSVLSGSTGYALGGPVGMAGMLAAGEAARGASTALAARNAARVSEIIRSGGRIPPPMLAAPNRALLEGTIFGGAPYASDVAPF